MDKQTRNYVIIWLSTACCLLVIMILLGGITRLTHSGLSIVEWKPLMGIVPPVNHDQWKETFEKYKLYPEYQKLNKGMTLREFKFIFFWEYLHRIIGRLIGLVFIIPFLLFLLKKKLPTPLVKKLLIMFVLGGLQGFIGWFMVKSGLVEKPDVSHYRLAMHLALAFLILGVIEWTLLDVLFAEKAVHKSTNLQLARLAKIILGLICLQIVYGAFTAGLNAGYGYNTFPAMNGEWFPAGFFRLHPWWINIIENTIAVQFIHRSLGWFLLFIILAFWLLAKKYELSKIQIRGIHLLAGTVCVQFMLGVATLVFIIPFALAITHQLGAVVLFGCAVYVMYTFHSTHQGAE